jgi:hypothetical protein
VFFSDIILSEDSIRSTLPYFFLIISVSVLAFWSGLSDRPNVLRAPASLDCNQIVAAITNSTAEKEKTHHQLFKLRNSIWNKVITNHDFENFNESEYFRWLEIYKDTTNVLAKQNPISIEQKMALIEVINAKALSALNTTETGLTHEIEKLNALKLKKLAKHLESLDLSSKVSREYIEDFSADLYIILKGPPISLLDYFTRNKSRQMVKRLHRTVQEDMLIMGLKGILERIPEKESYTRLENANYMIERFFHSKKWKYFVVPYDLPWFERLNVSEDLLKKILVDGLDKHNSELIEHLKSQGKIDHYERFRKVYRPIAFSVGFMFYYSKFNRTLNEDLKSNQEEEKQKMLKSFDDIASLIEEKSNQMITDDKSLKDEQFGRILNDFRIQYGVDPTESEINDLKSKIYH